MQHDRDVGRRVNGRGVADVARADLVAAILRTRAEYLDDGRADTVAAINAGLCDEFACKVSAGFGHPDNLYVMEYANFVGEGGMSRDGAPFDREMLERVWPGVQPPDGFDWDNMDAMSAHLDVGPGTHVFLMLDGVTFHDAELPEGSPSFFDLPWWRRAIERWDAVGRPDPRVGAGLAP